MFWTLVFVPSKPSVNDRGEGEFSVNDRGEGELNDRGEAEYSVNDRGEERGNSL